MTDLNQGTLFAPLTVHDMQEARESKTLSPAERVVAADALSYALAMRSRGCQFAPEWTDEQVVEVAAPLLGRLRC